MPTPLTVMIVEDEPDDAQLMAVELRRVGFDLAITVVTNEAEYREALSPGIDVILADYTLPQFSAPRALELLRARQIDVPFIVVSGTIDEDVAVECMRQGAFDYLLKDRLARLGGSVRRALSAQRARAERRQARADLEESERRHRIIADLTSDYAYAMCVLPDGQVTIDWITGAFTAITGYTPDDMRADDAWMNLVHPEDRAIAQRHWRRLVHGYPDEAELRIVTRSGEVRRIHHRGQPEIDRRHARVTRFYGAAHDVTARRQAELTARLLASAVEHSTESVMITTPDLKEPGPQIVFVNAAFTAMTGYTLDEIRGQTPRILQGPKTDRSVLTRLKFTLAQGRVFEGEAVNYRKDGGEFVLEWKIAPIFGSDGSKAHYVAVQRDVTERKRREQALKLSEERYALAARGSNDGLWDWDLVTDQLYLSERWHTLLGYDPEPPIGAPGVWLDRIHPDDRNRFRSQLDAHLRGEVESLETEIRMLHGDGGERWLLVRGVALRDETGAAIRVAGSMTDVSERKRIEAALIHDALHDSLTGLPNRTLFLDRLNQSLRRAQRHEHTVLGVLMLGLDRFTRVNDSLGHAAGDELLRSVSQRLAGCIRASDTLARMGGDEFAILLDEVTHDLDATMVADRIRQCLEAPFSIQGNAVFAAVSVGIATSVGGAAPADDLLRDADIAMHHAKEHGRGQNQVFDEAMHSRSTTLLQLERDLRRAIERREFQLHYQPIVKASDGSPVALEALIRWDHPDHGMVPPGQFIAFAEETGLIIPIGEWALEQAIEDLHQWDAYGLPPVRLAFNLSVKQMLQENLAAKIARTLRLGGFPTERLELELTESMIMESTSAASTILKSLRATGIHVAVDDFGTGYSSLSYLHELPVSSLKIDRSFVQRIVDQTSAPKIIKMIVNIAHDLGLRTVAEGVETSHQRKVLRALGCDELQGFLFSKPLPIGEVSALFANVAEQGGRAALPWMRYLRQR